VKKFIRAFVWGTEGQDLIEYALLAATIALGCVGGMQALQAGLNNEFSTISSSLAS
jgi:Flp pilus assembly pilin Flp